jgi:hypothetical protein
MARTLPLVDQVGERPRVSSMSVAGIGSVHLVEVDPVGLQAAQAVLDLLEDPAA